MPLQKMVAGVLVDLTPDEEAALLAQRNANNQQLLLELQNLQADEGELDLVDVSLLQSVIDQITTERAVIAQKAADLQTALNNLPTTPTAAQFRAAIVTLANAQLQTAGALDNIDARLIKLLRAAAVLRKRSG
jgi:hypothetical protein